MYNYCLLKDYLLFIDTEGSDLPKKWDLPYSAKNNWPFSVQISWIIFTKDGKQEKIENHYILDNDFTVAPSALEVHGLTHEFLQQNGEEREKVLDILSIDLQQYQPLVVGHFMELDAHMIGADYYRIGKENPLQKMPGFCTMRASAHLVQNPVAKYLRLFDLYRILFNENLLNQHNALVDAMATADCFFELVKRGEINEKTMQEQVTFYPRIQSTGQNKEKGCGLTAALIILLILLTAYWI